MKLKLRHRALVAAGLAVPSACSPSTAHRGHAPDQSAVSTPPPEAAAAGPGAAEDPSPSAPGSAPTTTEAPVTTVTIAAPPTPPATTRTTRTTVTVAPFVMPEAETEQTDAQWWASQPGFVSGACGGSLPPCSVMRRESGGDPRIWNGGCYDGPCPGGSTASGKWQFLRSTWAGYGGYRDAADAPESVQDAAARALWAGGQGCSHWAAC